MIAVKYPEPQFRMKKEHGKQYIFDAIRKTWLLLTEEEWVRQNFVNYLIEQLIDFWRYGIDFLAVDRDAA